jgi:hypothetical protein
VADAFSISCWRSVKNSEDEARATREGWQEGPLEAIAAFERGATAEADAAANAAYQVKRMSEKAQQEFADAQDAATFHDPDPVAPKLPAKRSHHKPKVEKVEPPA